MLSYDKFQDLRDGGKEEIKTSEENKTQTNLRIARKRRVKTLGMIKSFYLPFSWHSEVPTVSPKKMVGWILRTFKTKEANIVMTLSKAPV